MKKKVAKRTHRRIASKPKYHQTEQYLVVVRGWMLLVAFALMLGIGAIVGNFINQQLDLTTPMVAGASISR